MKNRAVFLINMIVLTIVDLLKFTTMWLKVAKKNGLAKNVAKDNT
jgi:hypothetical protein